MPISVSTVREKEGIIKRQTRVVLIEQYELYTIRREQSEDGFINKYVAVSQLTQGQ